MSDHDIPTLTDLIEKGIEIKMSDLGLEDDLEFGVDDTEDDFTTTEPDFGAARSKPEAVAEPRDNPAPEPAANALAEAPNNPVTEANDDPFANHPGLELEIRRILDDHLERAFQEIKQALRRRQNKP